jgi:hypothetical protein
MSGMIICYTRCWPCVCNHHFEPPQWHRWADIDDVAHAAERGDPSPIDQRCGCWCADVERVSEVTP